MQEYKKFKLSKSNLATLEHGEYEAGQQDAPEQSNQEHGPEAASSKQVRDPPSPSIELLRSFSVEQGADIASQLSPLTREHTLKQRSIKRRQYYRRQVHGRQSRSVSL